MKKWKLVKFSFIVIFSIMSLFGLFYINKVNANIGIHINSSDIVLVDNRPESIKILWNIAANYDSVDVKINRWKFHSDTQVNVSSLQRKLSVNNGTIVFIDTSLIENGLHYRYQLIFLNESGSKISPYVFTPPKPIIDSINSIKKNEHFILTAREDTIFLHHDSVVLNSFDNFTAESLIVILPDETIRVPIEEDKVVIDSHMWVNLPDSGELQIRSRDEKLLSQLSDPVKFYKDDDPPVFDGNFRVVSELSEDSSSGQFLISWDNAIDPISGVSHYILKRKRKSDSIFHIIDNTVTNAFSDSFQDIGESALIAYKLICFDNVGNYAEIAQDTMRCPLGPEISSQVETTEQDNVPIIIDAQRFDFTGVNSFEINISDGKEEKDTSFFREPEPTLQVFLPFNGKNIIKIRARMNEASQVTCTTWSNAVEIVKKPNPTIEWIKAEHDTRSEHKHKGNIFIQWGGKQLEGCSFDLYRKEIIEDESEDDFEPYKSEIRDTFYYDLYSHGRLKIFGKYIYKVTLSNSINGSVISDTIHCNRAPIIDIHNEFCDDTLSITISNSWIESLAVEKKDIKLRYSINYENNSDISVWQNFSQNIDIPLRDYINNLKSGDTIICRVQTRAIDTLLSAWSLPETLIVDIDPPEPVNLILVSEIFGPDSTDGRFVIEWEEAFDYLSGLKRYQIERRIGDSSSWKIIENTPNFADTNYEDVFSQIGVSTKICYRVNAFDNVGNKKIVGQDCGRCLLGPTVSVEVDTTFLNSIEITIEDYDTTNVYGFEIEVNQNRYKQFDINSTVYTVSLDSGENRIKARALFQNVNNEDSLVSTWSNAIIVYRLPLPEITLVNISYDDNDTSSYKGHLLISWEGENLDGCTFDIYRKISGELDSTKIDSNLAKKFYVDSTDLSPLQFYAYTIVPIASNGKVGIAKYGEYYCKKAPILNEFESDFISDTLNLCIDNEWMEEVPEDVRNSLRFMFKIKVDNQQDSTDWQDKGNGCYQIDLKDLFDSLGNFNGQAFKFYAQAKAEDTLISAWSFPISGTLDIEAPVIAGNLKVEANVNSDFTDGWMEISWNEATDALSGLKNYQLWRKIGEDSSFALIQGAEELTATAYIDSFSEIRRSTTIYYKLKAFDKMSNEVETLSVGTRCLLGPEISVENETTYEDLIHLNWGGYDLTDVIGLKVNIKSSTEDDTTFQIDNDTSKAIPLKFEGENNIKIRALFKNSLSSTWSNTITVIKEYEVDSVKVEHDTSFESMHEGNLIVRWFPEESVEGRTFNIYRKKVDDVDSILIGTVSDTNIYIDKYDDYDSSDINRLVPFQEYEYIVYPVNPDSSLGKGVSGRNYCNRAPEITDVKYLPLDSASKIVVTWKVEEISSNVTDTKFKIFFCNSKIVSISDTCECRVKWVMKDTARMTEWLISEGWKADTIVVIMKHYAKIDDKWKISSFSQPFYRPRDDVALLLFEFIVHPGANKVVLNWEDYNDYRINCYKICRAVANTFTEICITESKNFIDSTIEKNAVYTYAVMPGIKNHNGTIWFEEKKQTHEIFTDSGRGFVPVVDMSEYAKEKFFRGDSLLISWFWVESIGERITDPINFRKAAKLRISFANNKDFINSQGESLSYSINKILSVDSSYDYNHKQIFKNLTDSINVGLTGDTVFIRITALDRYSNFDSLRNEEKIYYQSDYWDYLDGHNNGKIVYMIRDDEPPPDPDPILFRTKASKCNRKNEIDIKIEWKPKRKNETSGVEKYEVIVENFFENKRDTISFNDGVCENRENNIHICSDLDSDKIFVEFKFLSVLKDSLNYIHDREIKYQINTWDMVGNVNKDATNFVYYKYYEAPELLSINKDLKDDTLFIKWSNVNTGNVNYLLEWDDNLENLGTTDCNHLIATDTINYLPIDSLYNASKKYEKEAANIDNQIVKFYFHVKAIYKDEHNNESSWSNVLSIEVEIENEPNNMTTKMTKGNSDLVVDKYFLFQNYPNPFNSSMIIKYQIIKPGKVFIKIYDINGKEVRYFIEKKHSAGIYTIIWDGRDQYAKKVSSGLYIYEIIANDFRARKKCILLR